MRSFLTKLSCLIGLFSLVFCSSVFAYTLSGNVYGGSSLLPNAAVNLIDQTTGDQIDSTITDGSGVYVFTVVAGTYDLTVSAPADSGFANAPVAGIVVSTSDVIQDVILISGANVLSGVVRGVGGAPISNITVTVNDQASGTQVGTLVTDATGGYSFAPPPLNLWEAGGKN